MESLCQTGDRKVPPAESPGPCGNITAAGGLGIWRSVFILLTGEQVGNCSPSGSLQTVSISCPTGYLYERSKTVRGCERPLRIH